MRLKFLAACNAEKALAEALIEHLKKRYTIVGSKPKHVHGNDRALSTVRVEKKKKGELGKDEYNALVVVVDYEEGKEAEKAVRVHCPEDRRKYISMGEGVGVMVCRPEESVVIVAYKPYAEEVLKKLDPKHCWGEDAVKKIKKDPSFTRKILAKTSKAKELVERLANAIEKTLSSTRCP